VADAFAVKENIAFGRDGHAVDFFGGHGVLILVLVRGRAAKTSRGLKWPLSESQAAILGQMRCAGRKSQRQWR
jgi:hypothetical protein